MVIGTSENWVPGLYQLVIFLDKDLYSTLSLSTQLYKYVIAIH